MCMQSLNLPHVGCARSLPFGPSWLPMANNVPGLKHHSTRICKEYKEISTNKHSAQCCHAWHLSEDCREGNARERALTPTQARVCIETDPEVMAAGTFQGGFYNLRALREWQNLDKRGKKFFFLLVLKWLTSNKDTRNKYISINPLKVVSFSSSLLPKRFIKAIGFSGATQNHFAGKGCTKTFF